MLFASLQNLCGLFCCCRLEVRASQMKKVVATLRALVEVMEALSKDADPDGVGGLIMEEVQVLCCFRLRFERLQYHWQLNHASLFLG